MKKSHCSSQARANLDVIGPVERKIDCIYRQDPTHRMRSPHILYSRWWLLIGVACRDSREILRKHAALFRITTF